MLIDELLKKSAIFTRIMRVEFELSIILNGSLPETSQLPESVNNILQLLLAGHYEQLLESDIGRQVLNSTSDSGDELDTAVEESVKKFLKNSTQDLAEYGDLVVLSVAVSCLQLYIQNNWTGPPTELSPWRHLSWVQEQKVEDFESAVHNLLGIDGEPAYTLSKYPLYILIAKTILLNCRDDLSNTQTADLWLMRCLQIQQSLLNDRSATLKSTIFDLIKGLKIKEPLMTDDRFRSAQIQFHLEAGHLCYFYYDSSEATAHFNQAKKISGLSVELAGVLGKRTKFQEKSLAQLMLKIAKEDGNDPVIIEETDCELPKNVSLNDEVVLNEISVEEDHPDLHTHVSDLEEALLLALCHQHKKHSDSHGDILKEECLAFVTKVLSEQRNWSVQSMALLMRTYWESESPRRLERTMAQLEELVNQLKTSSKMPSHRTHLVYCSRWQPIWQLRRELGQLLLKIGLVKSALDIFLSLEMWEEIISCYQSLGRTEAAEKVIRSRIEEDGETPAMWCHLGNVLNDPECYRKAWDLSNHRYSRAQKHLAYYHLHKGQFAESIPCFEKTLQINPLQVGVWFSFGCAAMALENWDVAARAFRRCVSLETQNYEAWSNLASVYIKSKQKVRAYTAMQEALKCEYENWRLWENFLLLSTDLGEFYEAIRSYHRLLDLKDKYSDDEVLGILVKAVVTNVQDASGQPASQCRPKLLELMGRVTSKVTTNSVIWKEYSRLLTEGKDSISSEDRHKALQYLQKSHRCLTQAPGWEKDVDSCQEVIKESVDISKRFQEMTSLLGDKLQAAQFLSSARLMLKGTLSKITKQHTDSALGSLHVDLVEGCKTLEEEVSRINELANQIRDA